MPRITSRYRPHPIGRRRQRGFVLILFAFALIPFLGMIGLVVDLGQGWLAKARLQTALQASALAALRAYDRTPGANGRLVFENVLRANLRVHFGRDLVATKDGDEGLPVVQNLTSIRAVLPDQPPLDLPPVVVRACLDLRPLVMDSFRRLTAGDTVETTIKVCDAVQVERRGPPGSGRALAVPYDPTATQPSIGT